MDSTSCCGPIRAPGFRSSKSMSYSKLKRDHGGPLAQWDHGGPIAVKTTVVHDHVMSREDPQFKLRMPQELRLQAEQAAKAAGRSINAELVARIESSFLNSSTQETLISAKRAKELALMARTAIPNEIRKRAIMAIQRAVSLGHTEAYANLTDLSLEVGISDEDLDNLISPIIKELEKAGYNAKLDDITTLTIEF